MTTKDRLPGLPEGVISRSLLVRDLDIHILEAGKRDAPLLLLLHGFPELAYSWRKVLVPLANLGYHVVAPDQRGYGCTKPYDASAPGATRLVRFEDDFRPYGMMNLARDVVALVYTLEHKSVAALIGHDFGSLLAGNCVIARPDLFERVVFMSAPYNGPSPTSSPAGTIASIMNLLKGAQPPRKHYITYFSGPTANADMLRAPQGLHDFLRAYIHAKSGDWAGSGASPQYIPMTSEGLATLPPYYIMPADETMAEVARKCAPSAEEVKTKSSKWLPESELGVYVSEYARAGFQGGLNWYRSLLSDELNDELSLFAGRRIEVPAMYIAGMQDWGTFQMPGALDKMQTQTCTKMDDGDVVRIEGAGHWVQQEKPERVVDEIARFLKKQRDQR
ncbi:alpha/beta-hydrolase [Dichomitus squalens]|uniref:Alpha/beta-hydrolase n=1 Tax=Dichomitus squalens TaxID=114155 RepID=A0A4Q9P0W5_9APHY|nr:alpha/beta-hydrolase [Dichomitus squalens]TBU57471.1 alpha/beta-hydrolase [Dichomitus squalens]